MLFSSIKTFEENLRDLSIIFLKDSCRPNYAKAKVTEKLYHNY